MKYRGLKNFHKNGILYTTTFSVTKFGHLFVLINSPPTKGIKN